MALPICKWISLERKLIIRSSTDGNPIFASSHHGPPCIWRSPQLSPLPCPSVCPWMFLWHHPGTSALVCWCWINPPSFNGNSLKSVLSVTLHAQTAADFFDGQLDAASGGAPRWGGLLPAPNPPVTQGSTCPSWAPEDTGKTRRYRKNCRPIRSDYLWLTWMQFGNKASYSLSNPFCFHGKSLPRKSVLYTCCLHYGN